MTNTVLMNHRNRKPFAMVRSKKSDLVVTKKSMQTLLSNSANTVDCHTSGALAKQERANFQFLHAVIFAKEVDETASVKEIRRTDVAKSTRIVMVAMDGEDRKPDVEVGIEVVDSWMGSVNEGNRRIAEQFELNRAFAQAVDAKKSQDLIQTRNGGSHFVKEITTL